MSRTIPAAVLAELNQRTVRVAWMAQLTFDTNTLYLWTGLSPLLYSGNEYIPVGGNGFVSPITEAEDVRADGIVLQLSGIPSNQLALVIGELRHGLAARVWLALLDADWQLIDALDYYQGKMDQPVVEDNGETSNVSIRIENRFVDGREKQRRWNHQDQQELFPGDDGFKLIPTTIRKKIRRPEWGSSNRDLPGRLLDYIER